MSLEQIRALAEQRATIAAQTKALLDSADERKTAMTADENVAFDEGTAEMIALGRRMLSIQTADEQERSLAESMTRALGAGNPGNTPPGELSGDDRLAASIRSLAMGDLTKREMRELAVPLGRVKDAQQRALAKSVNTVGVTFSDQLTQHLVDTSSVLQLATVWQTSTGENIDAPITTSHGASGGLTAEGVAFTGTDPTISKRTLGAYAYKQLIKLSTELVNDAGFDILAYVAEALGINAGLALGVDLAVGNGSAKPSGVMQTTTLGATSATGTVGAPTADNLIDLFYSVQPQYRRSAKAAWLFRDSSLASVRKLKPTGTGTEYIFSDFGANPLSNAEGTILGKPVYTDPNIAATALNAKSAAFGDFSKFVVRLVNGVRFERSDDFAFNTDEVAFRAVIRGDSVLLDQTGAIKHLVGAAS